MVVTRSFSDWLTLLTCGCKTVPFALFENLGLGWQLATVQRIECQLYVWQDVRALLLPVVDKNVDSGGVPYSGLIGTVWRH